jgi:ABC-type sugar transport system ATPase subunit
MELYDRTSQSQFVAGFIGSPKMNFLPGMLARHGSDITFCQHKW